MVTYVPKADSITREWLLIDASNLVLGRLATEVARLLRGKHRATYTPHLDTGDFVVVVNAERVRLTGRKELDKVYFRNAAHRPGALKQERVNELRGRIPERLIQYAVRGMLPKNRLGRKLLRKLKVYRGPEHPHQAQQPRPHTV